MIPEHQTPVPLSALGIKWNMIYIAPRIVQSLDSDSRICLPRYTEKGYKPGALL